MCVSTGFAVLDFVNDLMLYAIWQASVAAIWWNAYHRVHRGGWPPLFGWQLCWMVAAWHCWLWRWCDHVRCNVKIRRYVCRMEAPFLASREKEKECESLGPRSLCRSRSASQ
jgi:hypothetical protein